MVHLRSGNWQGVARLMLSSLRKLSSIGAQFAICPDNTIHQAFDLVVAESPIPWLHIAEVVAETGSRGSFNEVIQKLKDRGCDAVVLGCTEFPLLVDPNDRPLPTLDSTRPLARAALKEALRE